MAKTDWDRKTWVSLMPNGIGQVKPNHYGEILKTIWRNRAELPIALRILTKGVCDGCALERLAYMTSRWTASICA